MGFFDNIADKAFGFIYDDDMKDYERGEPLGDSGFNEGDYVKFKDYALEYYDDDNNMCNLTDDMKKRMYMASGVSARSKRLILFDLKDSFIRADPFYIRKCTAEEVNKYFNIVKPKTKSTASAPKSETYTPVNFKIGDVVRFNSNATTFYNAKTGAKLSMVDSVKSDIWKITQFDSNSDKIVVLQSQSNADLKIKSKVSVLSIADNDVTMSKPVSQTDFEMGNFDDLCYADGTEIPTYLQPQPQKSNSTAKLTGKEKAMINNNYNGYQFTALGLSGSGKTCFMAGMYYKMSGGVNGYTLKADDDDSVNLTAYYEQMANASGGADRFPGGTNQSTDYSFELQYGYKTLEKFRWIDYAGGTLKNKNTGDAEEYQQLKNDIAKSEMLYIFVDGGLFQDEELEYAPNDNAKTDILTDIIMDSCSRQINHFLSEYANERKKLPPIAIVVTKYDLAVKALGKTNNEENMQLLYKVIQRAFNPLFPDPSVYMGDDSYASMVGIIPVSLGWRISEGGYTGRLRPINMHLPAYVGIWFMLKNSQNGQETPVNRLADEIEDSGVKFWLNGQNGKFSTLADGYLRKLKEIR